MKEPVTDSRKTNWSHLTQLNIKELLLSPPTTNNTDASHLSSVIHAKIYRQNATNVLTVIIMVNGLDTYQIPHIYFNYED